MILNLTGDFKKFTSTEIAKLSDLLLNMRGKGSLEGIILEMLSERDGLVDFGGNKIRVSLPEGVKAGDRVAIKTESKGENVELKVSQNDKLVTIKTPMKAEKDDVFHIKIPEKVNIKEVISNIKDEVINLKSTLSENAKDSKYFNKIMGKIESFIDESTIKLNGSTSSRELADDISKFIKKSGINFENKMSDLVAESESGEGVNGAALKEVKEDFKLKINSIINELKGLKETIENESARAEAVKKIVSTLTDIGEEIDAKSSKKEPPADFPERISAHILPAHLLNLIDAAATIATTTNTATGKADLSFISKIVDFAFKLTTLLERNPAVSAPLLDKISNAVALIQEEFALMAKEFSDKAVALIARDLDEKLTQLMGKLASIKSFLSTRESVLLDEVAKSAPAREMSRPEAKVPLSAQSKDISAIFKALKNDIDSLVNELKSAKPSVSTADYGKDDMVTKKLDVLIKEFGKVINAIEFQQLTNLKSTENIANYFALPMLFDEKMQMSEIVITSKKSKKSGRKGENDNRIEIYVDLERAGHIKVDFNVVNKDIIGNFYSVADDTVEAIENELPSLIKCLLNRDYNVIKVSSKKVKHAQKCEAKPEDKLKLKDIKIFDFKV